MQPNKHRVGEIRHDALQQNRYNEIELFAGGRKRRYANPNAGATERRRKKGGTKPQQEEKIKDTIKDKPAVRFVTERATERAACAEVVR